jgi:hypothetical protein
MDRSHLLLTETPSWNEGCRYGPYATPRDLLYLGGLEPLALQIPELRNGYQG